MLPSGGGYCISGSYFCALSRRQGQEPGRRPESRQSIKWSVCEQPSAGSTGRGAGGCALPRYDQKAVRISPDGALGKVIVDSDHQMQQANPEVVADAIRDVIGAHDAKHQPALRCS
jgi:hypothetical protein